MTGSVVRDGSFLSVLSVGVIFLTPISGSAVGCLDRPPLASQLVHSFETIRTTFGRLRRPSRRRSCTVSNPSRAASRIAYGGYVRSRHRPERHFEVVAGKVIDAR